MSKKLITAAAAATLGAMALSTQAVAGVSGTIGVTSEYMFRGFQAGATGGAAFASVDYAHDSGLAVGIWGIDNAGHGSYDNLLQYVWEQGGQEFDLYASYTFEASDDLSLSIGYTSYQYTNDDGSISEVNASVTFQKFTLAYDSGSTDDGDGDSWFIGDDLDTEHMAFSYAHNDVWTFTLGQTDPDGDTDDDEVMYLDIQVAGEISEVDVAFNLIAVDEGDAYDEWDGVESAMVVTVSKTFEGLGL